MFKFKLFFLSLFFCSFYTQALINVDSLDVLKFQTEEIEKLKDTNTNKKIVNKKIKNIVKNYEVEQFENTDLFIVTYDKKEIVTSHLLPFLFNGNTVQIKDDKPQRLLVKSSEKEFNRFILRMFNKEDMILFETTNLNKKGTIYVFFDFSCPYCQKFHESSLKYINESGYSVAYLPFFKNPDNYSVNNYLFNIFCLEDNDKKKDLINKAVMQEYDENLKTCDKKEYMKKNFELAEYLKIKGTPTLIFNNGNKIEGYVPLQQLLPEIHVNYN